MKEAVRTPEWIAKNKAANQAKVQDPEHRKKHQAAMKEVAQKRVKPFIATHIITGEEIYCDGSIRVQSKLLGLNPNCVSHCLNGRQKQHNGYIFRYA